MNPVTLYHEDCRDALRRMIERGERVHSCVSDPPYLLESIVKRFGKEGSAPAKHGSDGRFSRQSRGFMGQTWDGADADGTRIPQDPEFWKLVYDVLLPGGFVLAFASPRTGHRQACAMEDAGFWMHPFIGWAYGSGFPKGHSVSKAAAGSPEAEEWEGWFYGRQTLKPALEPIYVAQKPFETKSGFENVLRHGVGAFNIDACRVPPEGEAQVRWPANLIHDGSDVILTSFPDNGSAARFFNCFPPEVVAHHLKGFPGVILYYGKANKADRAGSKHPTVKPIGLMRHLIRLVTPPGGIVLDPFAGSGTTGQAAIEEGCRVILVEREDSYAEDIRRRLNLNGEAPIVNLYRSIMESYQIVATGNEISI